MVIPALSIVALVMSASTEVKFVIIPLSAYIAGTSISLLNAHLSGVASYVILALAANTVIPAPSAWLESWAESARTMFLSLTVTVVELTIVSVPSTCRSPLIITLPVLSPTAAGSMIKVSGPFIWPVIFKIPISALSINAWPISAESI